MDINHINLPASVIAGLYKNSLVEVGNKPGAPAPPVTTARQGVKYLGENQKNILIVVDYDSAVYLPDEELVFLTNMLTACKLSLADVAIINRHSNQEAGYRESLALLRSRIVLLFGVSPASFGVPVDFPHFQVQQVAGVTILFSPSMEERKKDELLKSRLWVCLRKIFNL